MKYFAILLVAAAFALASDDGCTEVSVGVNPGPSGSDDISLTLINDWTQSQQVLGLDVFEDTNVYVLGSDRNGMIIQAYDAGVPAGTLALDAANTNCFGVAWNDDLTTDAYYTDDWTDTVLYYTEDFGTSWTTETNPAGNLARGMAHEGTNYWTTNGDGGGLWRFTPGVGQENIAIPEVPTQPSGVAVFPYNGNLGVAVTTYNTFNIYFYEWDGSTMTYIGSAACPVSGIAGSYGLAYSNLDGYMYWSYRDGSSAYHLVQFSFDITALSRSSWGAIKTSF